MIQESPGKATSLPYLGDRALRTQIGQRGVDELVADARLQGRRAHVRKRVTRGSCCRTIDIWWRAKENGSLMMTLAHLLQANRRWRDHTIRVLRIIKDEAGRDEARRGTENLIAEARFHAQAEVIVSQEKPLLAIGRVSRKSAVCFVGVSMQTLATRDDPLADYSILVGALEGNLFLTKNWHDLEL